MDLNARLRFDHEVVAVEHEHDVSCMLGLTAPPAPATHARRPLALALVIDRWGPMQGEKLDVTRRCATFLVEHLTPTDHLAIVSFDDQVTLDAPPQPSAPRRRAVLGPPWSHHALLIARKCSRTSTASTTPCIRTPGCFDRASYGSHAISLGKSGHWG